MGKYYLQIDLRILFLNNNSVGGFFNNYYNDHIPDLMNSNTVLKYSCPQCSETYGLQDNSPRDNSLKNLNFFFEKY